jgi:hypothetical protein
MAEHWGHNMKIGYTKKALDMAYSKERSFAVQTRFSLFVLHPPGSPKPWLKVFRVSVRTHRFDA